MGGTVALSIDQALPFAPAIPAAPVPAWREYLDRIDAVPDLGVEIGSGKWWRGLATCVALCAGAVALHPGFRPIIISGDAPLAKTAWEERRALGIAPLAQGADSGKRMAAADSVVALAGTPERPMIDLTATLGPGDGFARLLDRAGVSNGDAARVSELVSRVTPLGAIEPGTAFQMTLGRRNSMRQPRPLELIKFRARFDMNVEIRRIDGALALRELPIAVDRSPVRIQGRVGESLYRSARAAGAPPKVVEAYLRAIGTKVSLGSDVNSDARFDMIAERQRAETGEVKFGRLLFAGMERGSRKTQLLEWTVDGRSDWFEASGVGQKRPGMTQPVYGRITSGFGMRFHPLLGYSRFHQGVDFGARHGSPIYAVSDGYVSMAGRRGGNGNFIKLEHSGGMATSYSHLSRYAVSSGQRVAQGQVIGYVGSTGLSTGPHLHFQVYRRGAVVNPRNVTFAQSSLLTGNELSSFRARLKGLLAIPVTGQ